MTIEDCYRSMGGDWEGIKRRLNSEKLIERLSVKFLSTSEYANLGASIDREDWENAFMNAHTLKGMALNLGFNNLAKATSILTELLRPRKVSDKRVAQKMYLDVTKEYNIVSNAIRAYVATKN